MTRLGLGIDIGGTALRWALACAEGDLVAEGELPFDLDGHLMSDANRSRFSLHLRLLAQETRPHGQPSAVLAGITGLETRPDASAFVRCELSESLGLEATQVRASNDLAVNYLDAFDPGKGYLVYAGTGSIAAFIDPQQRFHRAGGRGYLLDDAGGGYWIACEALRRIWRAEDDAPGAWATSPMARRLLDGLGGTDWQHTARMLYTRGRGAIGQLAILVALSADEDPAAAEILHRAGQELARLAQALARRHGARPVVVAGGAAHLHPRLFAALRDALGPDVPCTLQRLFPQRRAAQLAAQPGFLGHSAFTTTEASTREE